MTGAPVIDGRDTDDLRREVELLAPTYVPEWTPDTDTDTDVDASAGEAGTAVTTVFAEMAAEMVERLDRLPEKHFVAFLDTLGFDRAPPQVARLPLRLVVAAGAGQNVPVPAGTRALAETTGEPQFFEVPPDGGFEATPASLRRLYAVDPARDRLVDHRALLDGAETRLFAGETRQQHRLYLGHEDALSLEPGSRLQVRIETSATATDLAAVLHWEFHGTDAGGTEAWHELAPTVSGSSSAGEVTLLFKLPDDAAVTPTTVEGVETRWLRARLAVNPAATASSLPTPFGLELGSIVLEAGSALPDPDAVGSEPTARLAPDRLLHNDVPLQLPSADGASTSDLVYPFGATPRVTDVFYVASAEAFVKTGATVALQFGGVTGAVGDRTRLSWEYWTGTGWTRLPDLDDGTDRLTTDGAVRFTVPGDLQPTVVAGHKGHWIRARIVDGSYGEVTYTRVTVRDEHVGTGDGADQQTYDLADPPVTNESVRVDGETWEPLSDYEIDHERGRLLFSRSRHGRVPNPDEEIRVTYQGGSYEWRLEGGTPPQFARLGLDYGTPTDGTAGLAPRGVPPDHVLTENNRAFGPDRATTSRAAADERFRPFTGLPDADQTLYLGFDAPLVDGPIQLLVSAIDQVPETGFRPRVRWEYCVDPVGDEWTRLSVADETESLTARGIVGLVFPEPTVATERFGESYHWLRARVTGDRFGVDADASDPAVDDGDSETVSGRVPCETSVPTHPSTGAPTRAAPTLRGLHPNVGWAVNVRRVDAERLGSSDGSPGQSFTAATPPILDATVEVDEVTTLSVPDVESLRTARPSAVEVVSGPSEEPRAVWVHWTRVDDFLASGPADRHYVLDWATGTVSFGDGVNGRVPPVGRDNVRIGYTTGGGDDGNVDDGTVASLVSSLPFVAEVGNPEAADGGADGEPMAAVLDRAPRELRDRDRGVTAADVERVALSTSRKLARVTSLPSVDDRGADAPGWLTLVIVPRSRQARPVPSVELRSRVATLVSERAPATLVAADRLVVRGPSYVSAAVETTVVVAPGASVSTVERTATAAVDAFLHPLTGGPMDDGWRFGELPCPSDLYALLEGVEHVDHVTSLTLVFRGRGEPVRVRDGDPPPTVAADALVYSGTHEIDGRSDP